MTPGGVGEKVGGDKPVGHQREGVVGKAGVLLKKMHKTLNGCNFYQMLVVSIDIGTHTAPSIILSWFWQNW